MRKHLALITDHPDESKIGCVEGTDSQSPSVEKNVENVQRMRNWDTDERWERSVVGMGYVDFADEDEYHDDDRYAEIVQRKLGEIDDHHLESAGLDPEEVGS